MATQERDPRAYELMTVFVPDLSDEDTQSQVDKVVAYITNAGGSLTETLTSSPWGRRRLAYTIRFNGVDYRDGVYSVYHFDSAPSNLTELERDLKLDTSTIRYLLVHDDPKAGEKLNQDEAEEGAAGEAGTAAAAGEPAPASTDAAASEPNQPEAATEPSAAATEATTETDAAPAESSDAPAAEPGTPSESESSDDTAETNEDESSDKE